MLVRGFALSLLVVSLAPSQEVPTGSQEPAVTSPPAPAPRQPSRKKAAGEPVRLAVTTTAVQTSVLVRAYDQFREVHGSDKLVLDLWVEQEHAKSPRPLEFEKYDMVLALRCSIPGLERALAAAETHGVWVVGDSNASSRGKGVPIDELPDLARYYRSRSVANMVGLLEQVCALFGVPDVQPREPAEVPTEGIYHPDADRVFADAESYWKWYAARPGFKPDAAKIGIFVYNTLYLNEETDYFTQLVRGVERAGASPVLGFWFLPVRDSGKVSSPIGRYFAGVDVLLTSSFRLINEKACHYEELVRLNVPVLNSIILNSDADEWLKNRQGIPASYLLPGIVAPELSGVIEPTVIAARRPVDNPRTKQRYYRTVLLEENFHWQVRRALAWAHLRRTKPADRRIAILFYNHGGGKHNVGASYLNVTTSLERILAGLDKHGYHLRGKLDRQSILDSMLAVGRNAGRWAPAEVEQLAEKGAILWPLEEYLAHYDRLPERAKRQMSQQWGQPPGEIMTVNREGKRCFVLPAFELGNVLLAPQPARAASDQESSLYHDPLVWPTHQYLAFYFWLRHEWHADAVVHLGRHGTLEFLPGKSNGLAWDDPPALVLGDLPNLYPYIVDGIGEAVAAKRRGQAVLLTHATPPLTGTALYGDLARLQELTNRYAHARDQKQSGLQAEYHESILKLAAALGYQQKQTPAHTDRHEDADREMTSTDRSVHDIEHWLADVQSQSGPRGLHTFGEAYALEDVQDMLPRMFADELQKMRDAGMTADQQQEWLVAAAEADSEQPPSPAAVPETASDIQRAAAVAKSRIESTAWHMRHNREIDYLLEGIDGRFLPVGPPGDPLSNPDIFPTGRNQYQYNSQKLPTAEAWAVGQRMAEQTVEMHRQRYGENPSKLSVTLWANTLIRTHGALESEVLYLLGVEPVWDQRGDVTDVKLVAPLGRPRVDVVMTVTGMYRDSFPDKMLLLDKAIRLAHDAPPELNLPNHVLANTNRIAAELAGQGADPKESQRLALLRIFGAQTGQYGTGVRDLAGASHLWSQRAEVAKAYLQRMSFAFSTDGWSQPAESLFERQLRGVQGVIHGRSSNLYGIMDLTENFEYQGTLALAVEQLDGKQPDLYVNDLVRGQKVLSGREAVVLEQVSRYRNPEFIRAMMSEGYDGARYFSRIADNQYGWEVVSDVITAEDWQAYAEIYLQDKYQLGLREFFDQQNPHARGNIASRVLETHRKGLQQLDEKTLQTAACAYVETIAQHGAACASHICDNPELATFAEKHAGASRQLADGTLERFQRQLQRTGNAAMVKAASVADGSKLPSRAPKPVQGHVLLPVRSEAKQRPVEGGASSQSAEKAPPPSPPASPSDSPIRGGSLRAATFLVGVASLVAFLSGMLWRATRNGRRK